MKKIWIGVGVLIASWLLYKVVTPGGTTVPKGNPLETLTIAADLDSLTTLDPAENFELSGFEIIANVYETLVGSPDLNVGGIKGVLAESWDFSEEGKFLTFKLKQDRKFASGNPVGAKDVAFSLIRLVKMGKNPAKLFEPLGWTADNVEGKIKIVSDHELRFEVTPRLAPEQIVALFMSLSASIVDAKETASHGAEEYGAPWLRQHTAGSGPFQVETWIPQQYLTLNASPNAAPTPLLKQIVFRFAKEVGAQELLLRKGEADVSYNLLRDVLETLPDVTAQTYDASNLKVLHLNQKCIPLAKPKVREAIRHLIDYQGLVDHVKHGLYKLHNSFVPSQVELSLKGRRFPLDVAKAKALLAEAGYPDGFTVTLSAVDAELAQKIAHDLAQGGIQAEILLGDSKQVLTKLRARQHDMALSTAGCDPLDLEMGASTFLFNPDNSDQSEHKTFAWRNAWDIPELSRRVSEAKFIKDPKAREAEYQALQELFFKDAPLIVMVQENKVVGMRKTVAGITFNPVSGTLSYAGAHKTSG